VDAVGRAQPSDWVARFAPLVPAGAPVLDVACGQGRHTRLFASLGHPVTAVDIDASGVGDLAGDEGVEVIEADLEHRDPFEPGGALAGRTFGGIVVTNYLHRPLLPSLLAALSPGGVLIYETFAEGNSALGGRVRNPDYLLRPGELLEVARGLHIVAYEDVVVDHPQPAAVQRICAVKPAG
jgi:SAM-dependent methyltransferase